MYASEDQKAKLTKKLELKNALDNQIFENKIIKSK
jgi:hypothetical protein